MASSGICYAATVSGLRLRPEHLSVILVHNKGLSRDWLDVADYSGIGYFEPVECHGYFRGGQKLQNVRIEGDSLMADDCVWPNSSIRATGAYLMQNSIPVAYFSFPIEEFSNMGTFTLSWSPTGIIGGLSGHGLGLEAPAHEPPSPSSNSELLDAIEVYLEHR